MQKKLAGGKDTMNKEQLGELILASEDTLYHVAKTLLGRDAAGKFFPLLCAIPSALQLAAGFTVFGSCSF